MADTERPGSLGPLLLLGILHGLIKFSSQVEGKFELYTLSFCKTVVFKVFWRRKARENPRDWRGGCAVGAGFKDVDAHGEALMSGLGRGVSEGPFCTVYCIFMELVGSGTFYTAECRGCGSLTAAGCAVFWLIGA